MMSSRPDTIHATDSGVVWFTVWDHTGNSITGGRVIRLNPATNELADYTCPPLPAICLGPTGLDVDVDGKVWFSEYGSTTNCGDWDGSIQRLDPNANPPTFERWQFHEASFTQKFCADQVIVDFSGDVWVHYDPTIANGSSQVVDRLHP
jgi:streptogramin lyase